MQDGPGKILMSNHNDKCTLVLGFWHQAKNVRAQHCHQDATIVPEGRIHHFWAF